MLTMNYYSMEKFTVKCSYIKIIFFVGKKHLGLELLSGTQNHINNLRISIAVPTILLKDRF